MRQRDQKWVVTTLLDETAEAQWHMQSWYQQNDNQIEVKHWEKNYDDEVFIKKESNIKIEMKKQNEQNEDN